MNMRVAGGLSVAVLVVLAATAHAQSATQTVTFQVNAVNQLAVTGSPSLTITTAVAGNAPTQVNANANTWAVTTNQTGAKVTASIAAAMPPGVTLSARMFPPAAATSTGMRPLGVAAVDLVTGITKLNQSGMQLRYRLNATSAAGVIASDTRVVTFTITGGV